VYNRLPNEEIDYESDVEVHTDGKSYTVPAGTQIRLKPGESIFVYQGLYHDFSVEPGTGPVLLGEVSSATTTTPTTASIRRLAVFRRSRKMSRLTGCFAMSIRRQKTDGC